jgi:hypothetical protein
MDALRALATQDSFRQDIISNNIGNWIINGHYHSAYKSSPMKPLCQNSGPHPNALGKCLMNTPKLYTLVGTRQLLA